MVKIVFVAALVVCGLALQVHFWADRSIVGYAACAFGIAIVFWGGILARRIWRDYK